MKFSGQGENGKSEEKRYIFGGSLGKPLDFFLFLIQTRVSVAK